MTSQSPGQKQNEIVRRRDAALLRALKSPPKPHKEMVGKGKDKKKKGASKAEAR